MPLNRGYPGVAPRVTRRKNPSNVLASRRSVACWLEPNGSSRRSPRAALMEACERVSQIRQKVFAKVFLVGLASTRCGCGVGHVLASFL